MEYWVDCPKDGKRKSLEECERCEYHDGIALRDSKAWLRSYPLPNCDLVHCKFRNELVPVQHKEIKWQCELCTHRKTFGCSVWSSIESEGIQL